MMPAMQTQMIGRAGGPGIEAWIFGPGPDRAHEEFAFASPGPDRAHEERGQDAAMRREALSGWERPRPSDRGRVTPSHSGEDETTAAYASLGTTWAEVVTAVNDIWAGNVNKINQFTSKGTSAGVDH